MPVSDSQLSLYTDDSMTGKEISLLKQIYFKPLVKWCSEDKLTGTEPSLRLIDLEDYNRKYKLLKDKYSRNIIEVNLS